MPRMPGVVLLALLALVPVACTDDPSDRLLAPVDPSAGIRDQAPLVVMSQNLYLGADIDLLLSGADPGTVIGGALEQLQRTNFGARAYAIANAIIEEQPHLVGLQEVSRYEIPEALGMGVTEIDYLGILMYYIAAMGGDYQVAVYQPNLDISLPVVIGGVPLGTVRYQDGDAIIARGDVTLEDAEAAHFAVQQQLSVAGATFYNLHGWNAVTAHADGHSVRFVNTHLEIQRFADINEAQALELIETVADETLPVIMVGDFNSAANPHPEEDQVTDAYRMFRNAGFADLWLREAHSAEGLTCCQDPNLDNEESVLHSRLDLVLARYGAAGFGGQSWMDVLGDESADRFTLPDLGYYLWPADHAAVIAKLWPAPGIAKRLYR